MRDDWPVDLTLGGVHGHHDFSEAASSQPAKCIEVVKKTFIWLFLKVEAQDIDNKRGRDGRSLSLPTGFHTVHIIQAISRPPRRRLKNDKGTQIANMDQTLFH